MKRTFLSAEDTAHLVNLAFQRYHDSTRARMSEKTVEKFSNRGNLSPRFILDLFDALREYGIVMCNLESGGFGLTWSRVLSSARSLRIDDEQLATLLAEAGIQNLASNTASNKTTDD